MLSIKNNISNEFVIKKSRFISFIYRVDSVLQVESILNDLRDKYYDCTHICYAYVIDNLKRFSDDGEPAGTAGMPILNVLESNNLDHVLCCVVRYFGGIKLGAGGLLRAYSNSSSGLIDLACIVNLSLGKECKFIFSYDDTKYVDNLLRYSIITKKLYESKVCYFFKISCDDLSCILFELERTGTLSVLDDCFIEDMKKN
jgi:uncharacterized YigZ family protein